MELHEFAVGFIFTCQVVQDFVVKVVAVGGHAAYADVAALAEVDFFHDVTAFIAFPDFFKCGILDIAEAEILISAQEATGIHFAVGAYHAHEVRAKALFLRGSQRGIGVQIGIRKIA